MKLKTTITTTLAGLLLAAIGLSAQGTLERAKSSIDADLEQALEEYTQLQERIRKEKVPLSKTLNRVEREARDKRRELERAQRLRDASQRTLLEINEDIEQIEQNIQYLDNLLNDFTRRFEAGINIAEKQLYDPVIQPVKGYMAEAGEDLNAEAVFDAQANVVSAAIDRIQAAAGGRRFEGQAVVPGGANKDGTFVVTGPVSYFAAGDGQEAGLIDRRQPTRPKVIDIGPQPRANIMQVANTGAGTLPLDPTQNDALELEKNKVTLQDEVQQGGVWIWPIIGFFVLSILTAIFKAFEIYAVRTPKEEVLQEILSLVNEGKKDEALNRAKSVSGPFGTMLTDAVTFSGDSRELLEEVLYERMLETQPKLERLLPFIAVTAATAPLLGLLGTVTGMINTFQQITLFGTSDASKLAGGISEALVTTKYGLITAIPALVLHALLSRRAQGVMATMEKYAAAFVNGLDNGSSGSGGGGDK